jgi:alkylation response protein AidB-like acyl-CoA dehydrogenase
LRRCSDEKKTALGIGRFVDEEMIYRDAAGDEVARMTFRLLKFKPPAASAGAAAPAKPAARRPRPAQSHDNAFFWEGVAAGELRIQRCNALRGAAPSAGPDVSALPVARVGHRALEGPRSRVQLRDRAHHPPVPPFAYPNAIALIELDEGTRIVSNLVGIDPADIAIGQRVRVEFTKVDDQLCCRCSGATISELTRTRHGLRPSEELVALRDLARQIFSDRITHERLLALEKSGEWFDDELWGEIARAGLTALAIPELNGGGGLGIEELCAVFEEQGRHTAPVPLLATAVMGALPIAEFGTPEQRERWLRRSPRARPCSRPRSSSTRAATRPRRARAPSSRAASGSSTARSTACRWPTARSRSSCPRARPRRRRVRDRSARAGVTLEPQIATHREPQWRMQLAGAAAAGVLGAPGDGAAIVAWMADRIALALAATQIGVAEESMHRTARYIAERKQFGKAIATFQGVALRAADAWIDVEALRGVVMQAAWRVAAGQPASASIATAKWWAAVAGSRVVHTGQHLHGGIGSDIEYPIHRFFLWSKQNELLLGGARQQAAQLGAQLLGAAAEA